MAPWRRKGTAVKVEIWSDVACPFCYIGKRSFDDAFARFEHAADTEVIWRSFQLGPTMPEQISGDIYDVLAAKYGGTREQAIEMNGRVSAMATEAGLDCDFDAIKPTNTMKAHRLIHLAGAAGKQDEAKERMFESYFVRGENISQAQVLEQAGADLGLGEGEVRDLLAGDQFQSEVTAEYEEALELGIDAVPTFVFDRTSAVRGAQSADLLLEALNTAWASSHESQ